MNIQNLAAEVYSDVKALMSEIGIKTFEKNCPMVIQDTSIGECGNYYPDINMVVINPNKTRDMHSLLDTLAHEMCHVLQDHNNNDKEYNSFPYHLRPYEHEAYLIATLYTKLRLLYVGDRKREGEIIKYLYRIPGIKRLLKWEIKKRMIRTYSENKDE